MEPSTRTSRNSRRCAATPFCPGGAPALRRRAAREWPEIEFVLAGNVAAAAQAAGDLCERGPHLSRPYDPQLVLDRIRRALATRTAR